MNEPQAHARPAPLPSGTVRALLLLVFVITSAFHLWLSSEQGVLHRPPHWDWDEWDYENIAFNLATGNGFSSNYASPEFRKPYIEQQSAEYAALLATDTPLYPTTFRAPALPYLMSWIYRLLGRNFAAVRALNAFAIGASAALMVLLALEHGGMLLAALCWFMALADPLLGFYASHVLTEPLAVFGIALLIVQLSRSPTSRLGSWPAVAITGAALIYLRSMFSLWLPFILLALYLRDRSRVALAQTAGAGALCLVLLIPWAVRCSEVLGTVSPFGSQGGINLLVDYSDEILASRGLWRLDDQRRVLQKLNMDGPWTAETQRQANALGPAVARRWITEHPEQIPTLVALKVSSLWWRDSPAPQRMLLFLSLLSLPLLPRRLRTPAVLLLLASTFAVALTHNVINGRFFLPLHPLFHLGSSLALFYAWRLLHYRGRCR